MPLYLKPPCSHAEWRKIAEDFYRLWNFPMCVGALDGKYVMIQAPPRSVSEYFNYKGFHSIVLLAACDAQYCFTLIDVGDAGRHSDGGVFANSKFGKKLMENSLNIPPPDNIDTGEVFPYCMVADAAFPLKPSIMRPYPGKSLSREDKIFNYRLSRARRVIENTFGIMSSKWRIFRRPLIAHPDKAALITKATCCLHNYLQIKNKNMNPHDQFYCPPGFTDHEDSHGNLARGTWRSSVQISSGLQQLGRVSTHNYGKEASGIREKFKEYFLTQHGQLPWQEAASYA